MRFTMVLSLACTVLAQPGAAATYVDADNAGLQYFGRFDHSDPKGPRFEWTACHIRASFQGTSLGVRLNDGANNYNVFVDGELVSVLVTQNVVTEYQVASGLTAGDHELLLTKRTESYGTVATFRGLVLDDGAALNTPPPRSQRRIQFLGDSFSSGLNDESDGVTCDGRAHTNSFLAFAAYAACSLQADYHVLSRSGVGLVRNYSSPSTTDPSAYPSLYGRLFPSQSAQWDSTSWVPQVAVICLGLNDFTSQPNPSADQWKNGLHALVARVRAAAPGVQILLVGERFEPQIGYSRDVFLAERAEGNTDVHYCNFTNTGTYVCDHPGLDEHRRIAGLLVKAIDRINGWATETGVAVSNMPTVTPTHTHALPSLTPTGLFISRNGADYDLYGRQCNGDRVPQAFSPARP